MALVMLIVLGVIVAAFFLGRHAGITQITRENIGRGTWIEFKKPCESNFLDKTVKIRTGVQGLVCNKNKEDRYHILIGKPWAAQPPDDRNLYEIPLSSLRIVPPHKVPEDMLSETLSTRSEQEIATAALNDALFPPGFLEVQRLLNRS